MRFEVRPAGRTDSEDVDVLGVEHRLGVGVPLAIEFVGELPSLRLRATGPGHEFRVVDVLDRERVHLRDRAYPRDCDVVRHSVGGLRDTGKNLLTWSGRPVARSYR